MATISNTAATVANSVIGSAVSAAEDGVQALIIADVPFLGVPGLKQILGAVISYVGGKFATVLEETATFTIIDSQIGSEESGLSAALKNLIQAEKTGDASQIHAAIQAYANAQSALVGSDGSAPIH